MTAPVIAARGLTKRFGPALAVDDVDLTVHRGELVGLLGPNGAGKTTTLRLLLGLATPTSGTVEVLGERPGAAGALRRLGAVVEEPALYPYLSGRDHLRVVARYAAAPEERVQPALADVGLEGAADQPTRTYSLGMRQRLALAAALVKDPELLILDEPTNGLDPAGIQAMRAFLRGVVADGRTVLLSSHLLGEVQLICDRVVVLANGRKVADAAVSELRRDEESLTVAAEPLDAAARVVARLQAVRSSHVGEGRLHLVVEPGAAADVNEALVGAGIRVSELVPTERSLEELYFGLTGGRA